MATEPIVDVAQPTGSDTNNGSADDKAKIQSQQAEKIEGLIADIDLTDVPEDQRPAVKKLLAEKVKSYDSGYRKKTEALAEEKKSIKAQEEELLNLRAIQKKLKDNPELSTAIDKVFDEHRSGKLNKPTNNQQEAEAEIDKMIADTTDPAQREALRETKTIMLDLIKRNPQGADNKELKEEVASLKEKIEAIGSVTNRSVADRVDSEISTLEDEFGKDFIAKYREDVKALAIKYPNYNCQTILFQQAANDAELEKALLTRAEKRKKGELKRKIDASEPGGPSVTDEIKPEKDSAGRVNLRNYVRNLWKAGALNK